MQQGKLLVFFLSFLFEGKLEMICFVLLCVYANGSNVAAGKLFGIPLRGTHSHAFVSSFMVSPLQQKIR